MNDKNKSQIEEYKKVVDENLDKFLEIKYPEQIWESMRYSVLSDGKRIRPVMCLEACRVFSGGYEIAVPTACAIEMLHAQSLIHDDLPCMDNDDYRRGKLTNHKVFGESTAVLAGDALLSFAPQMIIQKTKHGHEGVKCHALLRVLEEFLFNAGAERLIGGQVVDIDSEGKEISKETLNYIHLNKTGALFKLALRSGAILGGAKEEEIEAVTLFAEKLGLAFQISDDILDETATLEDLGKTPGKDKEAGKVTYLSFYGLEEAKKRLDCICAECCDILLKNNIKSDILIGLVKTINERVK